MTPQQHLDRAEQLLTQAEDSESTALLGQVMNSALLALVHIGLATAAQAGVKHPVADQEAVSSAQ